MSSYITRFKTLALIAALLLVTACGSDSDSTPPPPAASPDMFNIDFSSHWGTPADTYGAAAAQSGVWNAHTDIAGGSVTLLDLAGGASAATIAVTATDDGWTGSAAGDTQLLLNDNFYLSGATWTVDIAGLVNTSYLLYIYGPAHTSVTTGDMTINGVSVTGIPGGTTLVEGTSHVIHPITVTDGTISMSGTGASFVGLSGLQIVPQ